MNLPSLDRLEALSLRGMKLGLAAIEAICVRLGGPEAAFASVLIAGTNGKGSTAATLSAIARAAGRRTGLYTSPHLLSATERVRIGADDASPEALDDALARVFEGADRAPAIPLTYFEAITAAAFLLFRDARVEVAILEVGLGGRFDATNVAPARLAVVTSISFDHMADLGDTLPAIAREKAGVFRRGRPALVRCEDPGARAMLASEASRVGAVLHDALRELEVGGIASGLAATAFDLETPSMSGRFETPLPGAHQAWNAALAVRAAELLSDELGPLSLEIARRGVRSVRWPGRLERLFAPGGRSVLLDGCHNPEGAAALSRFLTDAGLAGRSPLVFGAMGDKDVEGIAAALFPAAGEVVLVPAARPRGATPDELQRRVGRFAARVSTAPGVAAAIERLSAGGENADSPPIIVAGSLYLVGEARAALLAAGRKGLS